MSEEEVERLFDACRTNAEFRARVRNARRAYVETEGYELTEAEWDVFEAIDWDLSDDELLAQYKRNGPMRVT
jgi:predicted ribosomally synthesized peptide with nif11-like leader